MSASELRMLVSLAGATTNSSGCRKAAAKQGTSASRTMASLKIIIGFDFTLGSARMRTAPRENGASIQSPFDAMDTQLVARRLWRHHATCGSDGSASFYYDRNMQR